MKQGDWQAWVENLPSTPLGRQEVQAELERQILRTTARLTAATWQRRSHSELRALGMTLNELNTKVVFLDAQVQVA